MSVVRSRTDALGLVASFPAYQLISFVTSRVQWGRSFTYLNGHTFELPADCDISERDIGYWEGVIGTYVSFLYYSLAAGCWFYGYRQSSTLVLGLVFLGLALLTASTGHKVRVEIHGGENA